MSSILPAWGIALIAMFMAWPFLGLSLVRQQRAWARYVLVGVILTVGIGGAWVIPADLPALRFMVLIPFFGAMGKAIEFVSGNLRNTVMMESTRRTLIWLLVIQEVGWPETPEAGAAARRKCKPMAGRGLAKILIVLVLLWVNSTVSLHHNVWLSCFWMSFVLYFSFSGVTDLASLPFRMMGLELTELFNAPPLARNPRDFWSRRWNLWFTRSSNLLIFQPLGGVDRPLLGVSAVFIFSAILHEYMIWVALGAPDGRMTMFFLIHGVATIATTVLGKRLGRKTLMPRAAAIVLHIAWFTLTAPLFFEPIDEVFGVSQWRFY